MGKQEALEKLKRAIDEIDASTWQDLDDQQFKHWRRSTRIALEHVFGKDSDHVQEFGRISYAAGFILGDSDDSYYEAAFRRGVISARTLLQGMVDEVIEYWSDSPGECVAQEPAAGPPSNRVFVVHGHDEAAKESVARFLEKLELTPVILHEQANCGQTVIEKFEKHCDVDFAIVIMTPDDMAYLASASPETARPRARQNVVFELGYFVSGLGRGKVCALYKGDVEILSDYQGVLYQPMDAGGGWRLKLASELKRAGIDIDMNRAV